MIQNELNLIAENPSFRIHAIEGYISNIFLVEYTDAILLLDSGSINDAGKIRHYCEQICKRPMSDIKLCAVSHMHPDHAGGAVYLRSEFGIPVAAFHTIDTWYNGVTGFIQYMLDCRMEQFVSKAIGKKKEPVLFGRKINPDHLLHDNDLLPLFNDWKAVHIPGHTLHDIALYHEKEMIVHTGDAVLMVKNKFSIPIPVFFKGRMKRSYKKLSGLKIKMILPGHGDSIKPDNSIGLFNHMTALVDEPMNSMSRLAHTVSLFTPAVWKSIVKNIHKNLCAHDRAIKSP
jgi:glyoxylase-like metal-dependent hydrolase (beta-lactamase superfamily II)